MRHMKTSKDKEGAANKIPPSVKKETDTNPIRPELIEMIHRHAFGLMKIARRGGETSAKEPENGSRERG